MKIRVILVTAYVLTTAQSGTSQPASGGVTGTVFHSDGSTVSEAPVRVRNEANGIDARTRSTETGRFEFTDLPAGTYILSVAIPCCEFLPYVNDSVTVTEGQGFQFDIHLAPGNINVEGDDPAQVNADLLGKQIIPDLPVPRMRDGRPDLSGVWLFVNDPYPEDPKILDWVGPIVEERVDNWFIDEPGVHCLPGSPPISNGAALLSRFVQHDDLLVILLEAVPGFRQVYIDGRDHPETVNPTWMGHSIGHWEGDTLVVETIDFNDRGWTDIYPRTEMLRIEERYSRSDYGHLEVTITYEDAGVFTEPWAQNMTWNLAPQLDLMEYVCENNQWLNAGR